MTDEVQQLHANARRNQILDAAVRVFAEKGYHSTTIRDIAKDAGIADGTVYNYFDNKPALLVGIFERMRQQVLQSDPPPPPPADFPAFARLFLAQPMNALATNDFALFRIIISEMMVSEDMRRQYNETVLAPTLALAEPALRAYAPSLSDETAALTVRVLSALVIGLTLQRIIGDETLERHWNAIPDLIADYITTALKEDPQ